MQVLAMSHARDSHPPGHSLSMHPAPRQALGLVEALEARRFEHGAHGNATLPGPPTAPAGNLSVGSSHTAPDLAARSNAAATSADAAAGAVAALGLPAVPRPPTIVTTFTASAPTPVSAGSHHVELRWQEPSSSVQPPLSTGSCLPVSTSSSVVSCSNVSQLVEIAKAASARPLAPKAHFNGKGIVLQGGPEAEAEWIEVYRGTATACKVADLKPGTAYLVRLRVEAQSAAEAAAAAAKAANAVPASEAAARAEAAGVGSAEQAASVPEESGLSRAICVPSAAVMFQTVATSPSVPNPPSLASRERKALKLKWTPPEEVGGTEVGPLRYTLFCKPPPTEHVGGLDSEGFAEVYSGEERSNKVAKLLPGLRYSFKLQAFNRIGDSPVSLCSTFTTQATVPSQPNPPSVSHTTSDSIALQWTRPADNGSPVTSFRLERDDGQGGNDFQLVYAGIQLSATASGLRYGLRYGFRLLAENDEGKSLWSACAYATTAPVAPGSPCCLAVVGVHRTSATLSWRPPEDDGGSVPTCYEVQLQAKCRAALEHMGSEWLTIFQGHALACTISSLRAGCTYRSRVRSASAAGWGLFSVPVDVVTAPDVPDTPDSPVLGIAEPTFLGVQWAPPSHNGGAKISQYRLEVAQESPCTCGTCPSPAPSAPSAPGSPRSAASGGVTPPPVLLRPCAGALQLSSVQMTTAGDVCTAEIRDLTPSTGYFFRVAAGNAIGLGTWSEWARMATLAEVPLPPGGVRYVPERAASSSGLEAVTIASGPLAPPPAPAGSGAVATSVSVFVAWEAAFVRGAAVQQYIVEAALAAAAAPQYCALYRGLACGCLVKGLMPATEYLFRVAALSAVGGSAWSEVLMLRSPAAAPEAPERPHATPASTPAPALSSSASSNGADEQQSALSAAAASGQASAPWTQSVELSWRPPLADNGAAVASYLVDVSPPPPGASRILTPVASVSGISGSAQGTSGRRGGGGSSTGPSWGHVLSVAAPEISAVVSGLLPGRAYQFRVRAVNAVGCSAASVAASATTLAMPPLQPQRLQVASRTCNGLRVRWEEPADDNGSLVLQYELQVAVPHCQQPGSTDSNGQQQHNGEVNGTAAHHGDEDCNGSGEQRRWQQVYSGRDTQAKVSGLEPNQQYQLRCRAVNAAGTGPWCGELPTSTSLAPPKPPCSVVATAQPLLLAAGSLRSSSTGANASGTGANAAGEGHGHSIMLSWRAPEDPPSSAAVIGYEVMVAAASVAAAAAAGSDAAAAVGAVTAAWNAPVAKVAVGKGVTEWQVEGLAAGTMYAARVRAVGAEGSGHSGWSEEALVVTEGRPVPRASGDGAAGADGGPAASGKRGKGKKDAARQRLAAASTGALEALAFADDCHSVASSSVSSNMLAAASSGSGPAGSAASFRKAKGGQLQNLTALPAPGAPGPAQRKQPKAKTLVAAAAVVPMAAKRPSRQGLLEQKLRKVRKAASRHWWKVLLVWMVSWLLHWLITKA